MWEELRHMQTTGWPEANGMGERWPVMKLNTEMLRDSHIYPLDGVIEM